MQYTIFDIETDGLLDSVTKIHCLSYSTFKNGKKIKEGTITDYNEIRDFCKSQECLVGHNIVRYDIPVLEFILGIKIEARLIDTLALSWYLYPMRAKHNLESWGDDLGVIKPYISDWSNLKVEDYIHRCESDVQINSLLYEKLLSYLNILYEADLDIINNLINYLVFKLDCAREQEKIGCRINLTLVERSLLELNTLRQEKLNNLIAAMPIQVKYKEVSRPSKMYKKDGSISTAGLKWLQILISQDLPSTYEETVLVKISEEVGNPSSKTQLKDWLFTLGWEPRSFEYRKNSTGVINKIPQIYVDDEVCSSIKDLYSVEPALENLDMLSLINHRIGILEGFKDSCNEEGFTKAEVAGFTNTLRFKHKKPIVNLPKIFKFYGEQIRGSIIRPDEEHVLCGSDMSSLEDSTKQHYMYFFDPEYVKQMRVPGFDPHIDIGVLGKLITVEEAEFFKWYNKTKKEIKEGLTNYIFTEEDNSKYNYINEIRGKSKTVNFAGIYGAGPPKIAQSSGMPLEQARKLHKTYWERNKSVKQVAAACKTKTTYVDGEKQMWLYNPVSGFWYSLRYEKDKFSTLNQGTGVYCFDLWVKEVRSRGIKIMLQYHDEIAFPLKVGQESNIEKILRDSIDAVNKKIKLNVPLGISVDFGKNYAEIH